MYYLYYVAPRRNPLNRARNFINQKMFDEAIIEYKKALDRNPSDFTTHYRLGNLYLSLNKVDQGVLHLQEVLKINKFSVEVEKIDILKNLARSYLQRDEIEEAFQIHIDILNIFPNDEESLYHASFIALGQEMFEMANRYFDRLVKISSRDFNIFFGAGMASFQEQKLTEAIHYFKEALNLNAYSDIGNICAAYAQQNKSDYKSAINHTRMVIDNTTDVNASFIAQRLLGYILVKGGRYSESEKVFQFLLEFCKKNYLDDELAPVLYDLGFVSIKGEKTDKAYEYWNQAYQHNRNFRNLQKLITMLRKEMDKATAQKSDIQAITIEEQVNEWHRDFFPEDFIWKICGLKSQYEIDISKIRIPSKAGAGKKSTAGNSDGKIEAVQSEILNKYQDIDVENFRIISSRVLLKLGYDVDEILNTYKDFDGVDFLAHATTSGKTVLVWVRRWKDTVVGEIPLRNFAQAINDMKASEGIFITTSGLSGPAEASLKNLVKVKVITPDQMSGVLAGLL